MVVNFAFLQLGVDRDRHLAKVMVHSIREHHKDAVIYQISNLTTPEVGGVDSVIRIPITEGMMTFRMASYEYLPKEVIYFDTDVVIQSNLEHVFDDDFDVAFTKRNSPIKTKEEDLTEDMPYNGGVVFSRNKDFWRDCHEVCKSLPLRRQNWFGDQISMAIVARSGKYSVIELPVEYNFSPKNFTEDVSSMKIVHYKGERKVWMAVKYQELLGVNINVIRESA